MQSKERTREEDQKKEKTIYPFCIHDNCREAESILVAPLANTSKNQKGCGTGSCQAPLPGQPSCRRNREKGTATGYESGYAMVEPPGKSSMLT